MIVRLDLEDRGEPLADVDRARVLAGALQHLRSTGRQRLQMDARALVAAVLRPHHGENAELGQVRLAAETRDNAIELLRAQTMLRDQRGIRHRATSCIAPDFSACTTDSKMARPSALPSIDSQARSGCGIRPTTLRASLQRPAIADAAPFGFAASVTSPAAVV